MAFSPLQAAFALLALAPAAVGLCGDDVACQLETATTFAPVFRLDKSTIELNRCLPGHPKDVYWQRKANHTEIICESDVSKLENGEVPLFYHYQECGQGVVTIDYWLWYSHQQACLELKVGGIMNEEFGAHPGDWEKVAVHIQYGQIQKVRWHQHSGAYTLSRKNTEFYDSTHPVAYVGQDSHGSYHDEGGTGNCLYFQDYRRWEDQRLKVEGWRFLLDVKNKSEGKPEWFFADRKYLDDFPAPGYLSSNCDWPSCKGENAWVEATGICTGKACGCRKSDYCSDVPFSAVGLQEKPCDDHWANDVTDTAKDLFGDLFGGDKNAQISGVSQLTVGGLGALLAAGGVAMGA